MNVEEHSANYHLIDENTIITITKEELLEDFKVIAKFQKMLDDWRDKTLNSNKILF